MFYFILFAGPADVKRISANLPHCSVFSGKEGLSSAYLLAEAGCSRLQPRETFFFFFIRRFRGYPGYTAHRRLKKVGWLLLDTPLAASSSILTCKLVNVGGELQRGCGISGAGHSRWSEESFSRNFYTANEFRRRSALMRLNMPVVNDALCEIKCINKEAAFFVF